jgi:hypothetical protein
VVELADWSGLVRGRTDSFDALTLVKPMVPAATFWAGPFRATASDQRDYFVKTLQTCPPTQEPSLAIEQIVSQVGRLIGAPVCETSLIRIPAAWSAGPQQWPIGCGRWCGGLNDALPLLASPLRT